MTARLCHFRVNQRNSLASTIRRCGVSWSHVVYEIFTLYALRAVGRYHRDANNICRIRELSFSFIEPSRSLSALACVVRNEIIISASTLEIPSQLAILNLFFLFFLPFAGGRWTRS